MAAGSEAGIFVISHELNELNDLESDTRKRFRRAWLFTRRRLSCGMGRCRVRHFRGDALVPEQQVHVIDGRELRRPLFPVDVRRLIAPVGQAAHRFQMRRRVAETAHILLALPAGHRPECEWKLDRQTPFDKPWRAN